MDKTVPRTYFRVAWGILGYILATVFVFGVSTTIRCGGISDSHQLMFIGLLIVMTVILSAIYLSIREHRYTHHDHWKYNTRFHEDIGPLEQKCGQFAIIFVITAITIYADMWLDWLSKIASKILSM